MAIANIELAAINRKELGKGASRRLRKTDSIPAIIYGGDKAPTNISIEHRHVIKALENEAIYSGIFKVNIEGTKEQVVLKDLQRHPIKPKVLHIDFMRVKATDLVVMRVPLHFIGEDKCPAVKQSGGLISHQMIDVEIKCQAGKLPEAIEVDLSNMTIDKAFHLSELKLPEGAVIPSLALGKEHDLPVANAVLPRSARAEDKEADAQEESTE